MAAKSNSEQCCTRLNQHYVCGLPFPVSIKFKEEDFLSAINYCPLDDDIIISSYPKTGCTWVQYIVLQILHRAKLYPSFDDITYKNVPFMELTGAEAAERLKPPRFIKYHLPYNLTPRNRNAKYIYTIRNPKDTAVSYYNFGVELSSFCIDFAEFFDYFIKGEVSFGDYFDHVLSWYDHKDDQNILLLHYEELCRDVRTQILRIAEFLGPNHLTALQDDSSLFDRIVKNTSFSHMKRNLPFKVPYADRYVPCGESDLGEKTVNFFRKGVPGDWRNHLTDEQSSQLDEKIQEKFGNTELISLWGNI